MDSIRDLLRPAALQSEDLTILEADLGNQHHAKAIVSLLDSYAREPVGIGAPLPDSVKQRLIPGLRAQQGAIVFLAILRNEPVGIALCLRSFSTFSATPVMNLHDLAVLRNFRGRKIGRELLRTVEAKARALGCSKLTLEARETNERALDLYESSGFAGRRSRSGAPRTLFLEKNFAKHAGVPKDRPRPSQAMPTATGKRPAPQPPPGTGERRPGPSRPPPAGARTSNPANPPAPPRRRPGPPPPRPPLPRRGGPGAPAGHQPGAPPPNPPASRRGPTSGPPEPNAPMPPGRRPLPPSPNRPRPGNAPPGAPPLREPKPTNQRTPPPRRRPRS